MSDTASAQNNENRWLGGESPFKTSYGKLMMWYFLVSDAFTFAGFLIAYGALRFSSPEWPVPDFVFRAFPGGFDNLPLVFVTFMTFVLLFSSYTMVRAVQEGKRENKYGVIKWLGYTIIGGIMFLSSQAWEWNTLISHENMSVTRNTFGTHTSDGVYLEGDDVHIKAGDTFKAGDTYLIHGHKDEAGEVHFNKLKYKTTDADGNEIIAQQEFGPKAFGALFFFITGFHGFHVLSGVVILLIVFVNAISGLYVKRRNGYEMVEKVGLYWHFVDLVWVFIFLLFYLL
jgi:cytochrome c oxidase subunit 3